MAKRPAPKKRKPAPRAKAPAKRKADKRKPAKKRRLTKKRFLVYLVLAGLLAATVFTLYLDVTVRMRFEGKRFALPARVYARPLELYPGLRLSPQEMKRELALLHYRPASKPERPGAYDWDGGALELVTRPFVFADGAQGAQSLRVEFRGGQVAGVSDRAQGKALSIARLDPPLIGGIYPGKNEDRVLVQLKDAPQHLIDALIATEDHRYFTHHGLDPRGIARAVVVAVRG
ncbi:MAG: transglycosylase domain-containing protein, partial [Pseudomonadota bacterium]